jgi:hypothetical protein
MSLTQIGLKLEAAVGARGDGSGRLRAALASLNWPVVAVAAIATLGAALRLALAGGPMLNDEILALEHVRPLRHFWDVFWGISHDNNHFLTSLWLYWLDSRQIGPLALRAPSVLMGAALIPVMAAIGRRSSRPSAVIAAALTAFSYFFFNYSVEARGYAGLALAFAVAFDATERCIADPRSRARYALAAATGLGALAHFAMIPATAFLALGAAAALLRRNQRVATAIEAWLRIFVPAGLATLPTLAFFYLGLLNKGAITIGAIMRFDTFYFFRALSISVVDSFGLPEAAPIALVIVATVLVTVCALASRTVSADRKLLYAAIVIGLPTMVFLLRPFNAHVPRYYLVVPLILILLLSDLLGAWWSAGGARRAVAAAAFAAILAGDGVQIGRFQTAQAHPWSEALATIAASPAPVVATDFDDRIGLFVRYYNWREGAQIEWVAAGDICAKKPEWLLIWWASEGEPMPERRVIGDGCPISFKFVGRHSTWGLSKVPWALYERERG